MKSPEISIFLLNHIRTFQFLPQFIFLLFLNLELQPLWKFEVKKISEISEFSILVIGQKSKTRKSRKCSFFLLKPYFKLSVFVSVHFFVVYKTLVTATVKIWSKSEISKISEFSILGIGQNRKLENLWSFQFSSK